MGWSGARSMAWGEESSREVSVGRTGLLHVGKGDAKGFQ